MEASLTQIRRTSSGRAYPIPTPFVMKVPTRAPGKSRRLPGTTGGGGARGGCNGASRGRTRGASRTRGRTRGAGGDGTPWPAR